MSHRYHVDPIDESWFPKRLLGPPEYDDPPGMWEHWNRSEEKKIWDAMLIRFRETPAEKAARREKERVQNRLSKEGWHAPQLLPKWVPRDEKPRAKRYRDDVQEPEHAKRLRTVELPASVIINDVAKFCEGFLADEFNRIFFSRGSPRGNHDDRVELRKERPLLMFHANGHPLSVCANFFDFMFPGRAFDKENLRHMKIVRDMRNNDLTFYWDPR